MKTTREINVDLSKEKLKLRHVTTKDVDASVRVEPPKGKIKPRSITTTTLPDVADIADKKRRDDIMAERKATLIKSDKEKKLAMKDEKKLVIAEKEVKIITAPTIVKDEDGNSVRIDKIGSLAIEAEKKPWNKMNAKERKEYQIEKAKKKK